MAAPAPLSADSLLALAGLLSSGSGNGDSADALPRCRPRKARPSGAPRRYEIVFKQQVRAEDLFLGTSRKDPSTACCEDMLIKIKLPDTKASDITLDIQEKLLDFRSPQKRLLLHLPHPVDTTNGRARFLSEQATLEVTLRMKRELDFINFA
ncbi:protein PIH1D3 [Protobothrops mucrosquamatus]|uniref:protein PIH1D3 n=1 Tax=Protobothrops mucrosquamatus TaxID=103944 RepID=UPI000775E913|nr:protein PIH1D3 [Protobothrops mucrosquamatus]